MAASTQEPGAGPKRPGPRIHPAQPTPHSPAKANTTTVVNNTTIVAAPPMVSPFGFGGFGFGFGWGMPVFVPAFSFGSLLGFMALMLGISVVFSIVQVCGGTGSACTHTASMHSPPIGCASIYVSIQCSGALTRPPRALSRLDWQGVSNAANNTGKDTNKDWDSL